MIAAHRLHSECAETTGARPTTIAGAFPPSSASSISSRASAISCRRRPGSFSRHRWSSRAMSAALPPEAPANRARVAEPRRSCPRPSRLETPPAGQHLVEHAAECPDVRALVDRLPARLLRAHVGGRAEDRPACVPPVDRRRLADGDARRPPAFARPKSSTFTTPSGVTLMFAGLRSRWTMPFSCAASRASAI